MAFVFFTPIATTPVSNVTPTNVSQNVAIGTGATCIQISNTGGSTAYVLNAATVTIATGIPVAAGTTLSIGVTQATGLAVIGLGSQLTIISGT